MITAAGPRFLLRAGSERALERALSQLGAAYPQVGVERLDAAGRPDLDPALCGSTEEAASLSLAVALAAAPLRRGERVLLELEIASAPSRAASRLRARSRPQVAPAREESPGPVADAARLVLPLAAAVGGVRLYLWYQAGEILPLVLSGAGVLAGGALLALALRAVHARSAPLAPALAERKLAGPLFSASLRVTAIGPRGSERGRLPALARQVADGLSALDDPGGGGLRPGARRRRLLLNAEEAAALWHLPTTGEGADGTRRMRARRLPPPPGHALRGARVGTVNSGGRGEAGPGGVFLPAPLLHRNHLVVAKTRRGKSTLLAHLARGVMERALDDPRGASPPRELQLPYAPRRAADGDALPLRDRRLRVPVEHRIAGQRALGLEQGGAIGDEIRVVRGPGHRRAGLAGRERAGGGRCLRRGGGGAPPRPAAAAAPRSPASPTRGGPPRVR